MDAITVEIRDTALIVVHQGKLPRARLRYTSPVAYVYTLGLCRPAIMDKVRIHAVEAVLARGGTALSLRRVEAATRTKQAKAPEIKQLELWHDEWNYECKMCGRDSVRLDDNGHCGSCRQVWNS